MSAGAASCGTEGGCHATVDPRAEAPEIGVTINPEARVSAARSGPMPAAAARGAVVTVPVRIRNNGFVTTPLAVRVIGSAQGLVDIALGGGRLSGAPDEVLDLQLVRRVDHDLDVTIGFGIELGEGDLAWRDRVHLLLRQAASPCATNA